MAVKLNSKGRTHANGLIDSGKVDKESSWSFSAEDGNKILGDPPDWAAYGKWFLGIDDAEDTETKAHYKYPFGKNGKVYRSGLVAIRQRAGQQNQTDIFNAAGAMLEKIDKDENSISHGSCDMYVNLKELERRYLPKSEVRLEEREDSAPKIVGYAAVFNTWTDIGGWFKESIKPGAFAKTIKENDIRALMNHNENYVLGRNKAGTLSLKEDKKGLAVEIDPVPAAWADDLLKSMRRKDITQMSFGFLVNKASIDYDKDERVLEDVTLFDVSVVTFPAYPTTSAEVRAAFKHKEKPKEPDWTEFDEIVEKIKAGGELTPDEQRKLMAYCPDLSEPPAQHSETPKSPPAKHDSEDTRKGNDRVQRLLIKAERVAPATT